MLVLNFVDLPTKSYHSEFRLLDVREQAPYSEHLVFHVLELPKLPKLPSRHDEPDLLPDEPLLWKWGSFLRAKTKQELERLAMSDPIFGEAKSALENLSQDPKAQRLAEERRIAERFYNIGLRLEKEKAAAEGHAKGRAEGRRQLLEEQLEASFGSLPTVIRKRLQKASDAELILWAKRVRSAATLDDVFAAGG